MAREFEKGGVGKWQWQWQWHVRAHAATAMAVVLYHTCLLTGDRGNRFETRVSTSGIGPRIEGRAKKGGGLSWNTINMCIQCKGGVWSRVPNSVHMDSHVTQMPLLWGTNE